MTLTGKQRRHLRALAHGLRPAVTVGAAGLTPAVAAEIEAALAHHELLKIKLPAVDRAGRQELLGRICAETAAEPVQEIGRVVVIYRRGAKPRVELPA
jgi:RNA-binding protein